MPVEIRSMHTGKFRGGSDRNPTHATHPCTIDHYWIQTDDGAYAQRSAGVRATLQKVSATINDHPVNRVFK